MKKQKSLIKTAPEHFQWDQVRVYLILLPFVLVMLLPIVYVIFHAFKPMDELFAFPPKFITLRPTLDNFRRLMNTASATNYPMSLYIFNSLLSTGLTVVATVLICAASGYVLSKKEFRGKKQILAINQAALMFVPVAVAVPRFIIIKQIGLMDNFLAHILPLLAMPVGLFLVKQFIDQIPNALIEAAQIDGCSDYGILARIIVPNLKPALATVAILSFQSAWTSVEASQMFIDTERLKTFAYFMQTVTAANGAAVAGQGMAAAAALVTFVPSILLFIVMQSKVMNTVAHSGIK